MADEEYIRDESYIETDTRNFVIIDDNLFKMDDLDNLLGSLDQSDIVMYANVGNDGFLNPKIPFAEDIIDDLETILSNLKGSFSLENKLIFYSEDKYNLLDISRLVNILESVGGRKRSIDNLDFNEIDFKMVYLVKLTSP